MSKLINKTLVFVLFTFFISVAHADEYFESGDFKNIKCSLANGSNGYTDNFSQHFEKMSYTIQGNKLTTQIYSGVFNLSLINQNRYQFVQVWNDSEVVLISIYADKFVYSTNGSSLSNSRMCIGDVVRYTQSN